MCDGCFGFRDLLAVISDIQEEHLALHANYVENTATARP